MHSTRLHSYKLSSSIWHVSNNCLINLFMVSYFPLNLVGAIFAPKRGIMSSVLVMDVLEVVVGFVDWWAVWPWLFAEHWCVYTVGPKAPITGIEVHSHGLHKAPAFIPLMDSPKPAESPLLWGDLCCLHCELVSRLMKSSLYLCLLKLGVLNSVQTCWSWYL